MTKVRLGNPAGSFCRKDVSASSEGLLKATRHLSLLQGIVARNLPCMCSQNRPPAQGAQLENTISVQTLSETVRKGKFLIPQGLQSADFNYRDNKGEVRNHLNFVTKITGCHRQPLATSLRSLESVRNVDDVSLGHPLSLS